MFGLGQEGRMVDDLEAFYECEQRFWKKWLTILKGSRGGIQRFSDLAEQADLVERGVSSLDLLDFSSRISGMINSLWYQAVHVTDFIGAYLSRVVERTELKRFR